MSAMAVESSRWLSPSKTNVGDGSRILSLAELVEANHIIKQIRAKESRVMERIFYSGIPSCSAAFYYFVDKFFC
jgi:hypothetical protein